MLVQQMGIGRELIYHLRVYALRGFEINQLRDTVYERQAINGPTILVGFGDKRLFNKDRYYSMPFFPFQETKHTVFSLVNLVFTVV